MKTKAQKKIISFLKKNHLMTLSVIFEASSWSANCFYVLDDENMNLIFVSEQSTKHALGFIDNPIVSGTISKSTNRISLIKGIQFLGKVEKLINLELENGRKKFLNKFPLAILNDDITFWKLGLNYIKMTDNKIFFGSKTYWQRDI